MAAANARYSAAKAAVADARRNLAQTRLKAPADSLITKRLIATGSYLNQGDTVASLQTSSQAEVRLALSASQWQQLPADPLGEAVELHSRDLPGVRWQGNIERLSHNINANTRLRT
ncbi:efflux RND transporter periplasmic adaptor subunit [Aliamphritea spongicola]